MEASSEIAFHAIFDKMRLVSVSAGEEGGEEGKEDKDISNRIKNSWEICGVQGVLMVS